MQGIMLFDKEWDNISAAQSRLQDYSSVIPDAAELCSAYPNAGIYLLQLRLRPSELIRWLEAAAAAARQLNNLEAEAWHTGNLGKLYRKIGDPRRAIEYNQQAILVCRKFGDRLNEVRGLSNIALAYCELGELDHAANANQQALALVRDLQNRREEGAVLGNIGAVHWYAGNNLKAIEFYKQQLLISQETGDLSAEAEVANNIGLCYVNLQQAALALKFLRRASDLYEKLGDHQQQVPLLNNIGFIFLNTGEPQRALELFIEQEAVSRMEESPLGEGRALFNQAEAYEMLDNLPEALRCTEAAYKIYESIESADIVRVREMVIRLRNRVRQQTAH